LVNGHFSVFGINPRSHNIIEIACINCREPKPLSTVNLFFLSFQSNLFHNNFFLYFKEIEDFINASDQGFIYVSMGSKKSKDLDLGSKKSKDLDLIEKLYEIFTKVFASLPFQVLWKLEANTSKIFETNLPKNVKISEWFPQQDILGHKKLRAFVTHCGSNSLIETVYHGAPIVGLPVFYDHDVNAAHAKLDGYGNLIN
jgi:UDP:flavonoid glycosyltransferase YjiC (YdhE family)